MPDIKIISLLTTFNQSADRVAMHAVRRELVTAQAERVGLPLWAVELPWPCSNQQYESLMSGFCERAVAAGATNVAFGDLFLQDVREYRERQLQETGLEPIFPLWHRNTTSLANEMIGAGLRAKLTCVDPKKLAASFAGCEFDTAFLSSLPTEIDPCGENGEFHTFVYDCPHFTRPIAIEMGDIVDRDGFVFADVRPKTEC